MNTRSVALSWAVLALSGCVSPPEPPFEVVEVSDYLCLGAEFAGSLCRANVSLLDAQVEFVASFLGVEPPSECIPVLWTEHAGPYCGGNLEAGGLQGCFRQGVIYSNWRSMAHEIVHAVAVHGGYTGPVFIHEGLAEALSGKVLRSQGLGLEEILRVGGGDNSLEADLSFLDYESFGHLTAWLLDTFGVAAVRDFYRRIPSAPGDRRLDREIERAFGVPRAALAEAYALASERVYAGKGPFSCGSAHPELPWEGASAALNVVSHCDSRHDFRRADRSQVLGHSLELWRGYRTEVPAGEYWLQLAEPGFHGVVIESCLEHDTEESLLPSPPSPVVESWGGLRALGFFPWSEFPRALAEPGGPPLELPAGTYTLWLGWSSEHGSSITNPRSVDLVFERRGG